MSPSNHDDDAPLIEDQRFRVMRLLVNTLLVVLIAGVLTITISVLLALKDLRGRASDSSTQAHQLGLKENETLIDASSSATRVTLLIEAADGARRVVILDARTMRPAGVVEE